MVNTNIDRAKLAKLTYLTGFLGLDNFYLKKRISGFIKMFLFAFGLIAFAVTTIYIATTFTSSLQTAEELGRTASIKGPISNDTANGVNTNTAPKSLEYFLFAYNFGKNWILEKYMASFIFLGLGLISLMVLLVWWITCVILTKQGVSQRLNGSQTIKLFFTTHKVV